MLVAAMLAAGCASQNARFYTELHAARHPQRRLAGRQPRCAHRHVASVSRLADGNAGVAFDVDRNDADAIRRASIMVVRDDPVIPAARASIS